MGIKFFQSLLKKYANENTLLQSIDISNQYIVIDGSELIYHLYDDGHFGRDNCVEFRETIIKFFTTLRSCGIKPIVVMDGFKFEYNEAVYEQKRIKKIQSYTLASKKTPQNQVVKGYFSETVFKQTADEMKVSCFMARHDADEDLAALSVLLDAPVLATDTVFCAYNLPAGYIDMSYFKWKKAHLKAAHVIRAKLFLAQHFQNYFSVDSHALQFLGVVFESKRFDKFKEFRQQNLPNTKQVCHSQNEIEKFIIWYKIQNWTTDCVINFLVQSLPGNTDIIKEQQIIENQLSEFENPCLKCDLFNRMQDAVNDSVLTSLLSTAPLKQESEEREPLHCENVADMTYSGNFPYWALHLLIQSNLKIDYVHFLPLVLSDASQYSESPQRIAEFLRQLSYQILFRDLNVLALKIKVFDREAEKYRFHIQSVNLFRDERGLFEHELKEENIKKRRDFLLDTLITNDGPSNVQKKEVKKQSDDTKLLLAATIYWINQANPDSEMQKSMVSFIALMEMKEKIEVIIQK